MELIYLDNAATTRTDERVVEAMLPYFTQYYGNASTIYALGEESRKAVTKQGPEILLQQESVRNRKKYILRQVEVNLITGH